MEFDIFVKVIWFLLRMLTDDGAKKTEKGYRFWRGGFVMMLWLMGWCNCVTE
ncbi:hypothetical protein HanIR_Chr13g0648411 [Helianthus annuus]|nr:hypothetical protein HanIR_Chr13g0648411 [Helianthus annuus]